MARKLDRKTHIDRLLEEAGLSRSDLARLLGMTRQGVAKKLRGESQTTVVDGQLIANYLSRKIGRRLSTDDIFPPSNNGPESGEDSEPLTKGAVPPMEATNVSRDPSPRAVLSSLLMPADISNDLDSETALDRLMAFRNLARDVKAMIADSITETNDLWYAYLKEHGEQVAGDKVHYAGYETITPKCQDVFGLYNFLRDKGLSDREIGECLGANAWKHGAVSKLPNGIGEEAMELFFLTGTLDAPKERKAKACEVDRRYVTKGDAA